MIDQKKTKKNKKKNKTSLQKKNIPKQAITKDHDSIQLSKMGGLHLY